MSRSEQIKRRAVFHCYLQTSLVLRFNLQIDTRLFSETISLIISLYLPIIANNYYFEDTAEILNSKANVWLRFFFSTDGDPLTYPSLLPLETIHPCSTSLSSIGNLIPNKQKAITKGHSRGYAAIFSLSLKFCTLALWLAIELFVLAV